MKYNNITKKFLDQIFINLVDAVSCSVLHCSSHKVDVNNLYISIVETLNDYVLMCLPHHNIPVGLYSWLE